MHGIGELGGLGWLCEPWRAYLNRFSPAPSSHCGRCTLIRCAGTRDPCMQHSVPNGQITGAHLMGIIDHLGLF